MQATLIEPSRPIQNYRDDTFIPMLSGGVKTVDEIPGYWAIARCRVNHEKTLALVAEDSGFSYCLPLRTKMNKREGHGSYKTCSVLDKLRGYVFLASEMPPDDGFNVSTDLWYFLADNFSTQNRKIIEVRPSNQRRFVSQLQDVCNEADKEEVDSRVAVGKRCIVSRGFYRGKEGTRIEGGKKAVAHIVIEEIKYLSFVEIPLSDLEAI